MRSRSTPRSIRPAASVPQLLENVSQAAGLGRLRTSRRCRSGSSHATYRVSTEGGDVAVRIGTERGTTDDWQRDPRLASLRIAPQYIDRGTVSVGRRLCHYSVWKWLDGRPFDYHRDLRRLAETLAILHRRTRNQKIAPRDAPDLRGFLRKELRQYTRDSVGGSGLAGRLCRAAVMAQETLTSSREPAALTCLVHNDLVAENIIIVSGRARLIDWDWGMNAHPALDLCGFLSPFATSWRREYALSIPAVRIFLDNYRRRLTQTQARPVIRGLVDAWQAYNAMIANWLYRRAGQTRPHFADEGFHRRSFDRSAAIWAWLQAQVDE